jgi:hypothetical protein
MGLNSVRKTLRRRDFWAGFVGVLVVGVLLLATRIVPINTESGPKPLAQAVRGRGKAVPHLTPQRGSGTSVARPDTEQPSRFTRPTWLDTKLLRRGVATVMRETGAEVGAALRPLSRGGATVVGNLRVGPAWSTMKVPVILARYRFAAEHSEGEATFGEHVALAITESNNEAVDAIFEELVATKGGLDSASDYVQEGLRSVGDNVTTVNTTRPAGGFSTFGQTQWSLAEGTRFYRALADRCLTPRKGVQRILALMGQIVSYERWGIGQAAFRGASSVRFKGGWGPDPAGRYLVRQFGIVETNEGRGFVVGIATGV